MGEELEQGGGGEREEVEYEGTGEEQGGGGW